MSDFEFSLATLAKARFNSEDIPYIEFCMVHISNRISKADDYVCSIFNGKTNIESDTKSNIEAARASLLFFRHELGRMRDNSSGIDKLWSIYADALNKFEGKFKSAEMAERLLNTYFTT